MVGVTSRHSTIEWLGRSLRHDCPPASLILSVHTFSSSDPFLVARLFRCARRLSPITAWTCSRRCNPSESVRCISIPGSARASRAELGALAEHPRYDGDAPLGGGHYAPRPTGEGAGRNTRGRVCSPYSNRTRAIPPLSFSQVCMRKKQVEMFTLRVGSPVNDYGCP
jgi:hypothetical protein